MISSDIVAAYHGAQVVLVLRIESRHAVVDARQIKRHFVLHQVAAGDRHDERVGLDAEVTLLVQDEQAELVAGVEELRRWRVVRALPSATGRVRLSQMRQPASAVRGGHSHATR